MVRNMISFGDGEMYWLDPDLSYIGGAGKNGLYTAALNRWENVDACFLRV
jgi:hypothetical protein